MGEMQLFFLLEFRTEQFSKGSTHIRVDVPHSLRLRGNNAEDSTLPVGGSSYIPGLSVGAAGGSRTELGRGNSSRAGAKEPAWAEAEGKSTERESGEGVPFGAQRFWVDLSVKVKMKERPSCINIKKKLGPGWCSSMD